MAKGYPDAGHQTRTQELIALLRLSGARVAKVDRTTLSLRMGGQGNWKTRTLTITELARKYGPGTTEYMLLRQHPRAHTIKAPAPRNRDLL